MNNHDVPVLILGYQRFERILEIGEILADSKPCCVYVSIDGPSDERKKMLDVFFEQFRALFPSSTSIHCIAREANLGIAQHIKVAGDEVVANHDCIIILEDDCVPSRGFLSFMRSALEHHKENRSIGMVTANTFMRPTNRQFAEISDYPLTWGWGTFKRVWAHFDPKLSNLSDSDIRAGVRRVNKSLLVRAHWVRRIRESLPDSQMWDAQWTAFLWATGLKTINPSVELVSNRGMDGKAIHTKTNSLLLNANLTSTSELPWDLDMVSDPQPWSLSRRSRHFLVLRLEALQMFLQNLGLFGPYKFFRRFLER